MRQVATTSGRALSTPPASEWEVMRAQAEVVLASGLAPKALNTPEKILTVALKGRELSLPMMEALSQIYVVEGKPTLSAELKRRLESVEEAS